jgi:hypothetical protein
VESGSTATPAIWTLGSNGVNPPVNQRTSISGRRFIVSARVRGYRNFKLSLTRCHYRTQLRRPRRGRPKRGRSAQAANTQEALPPEGNQADLRWSA